MQRLTPPITEQEFKAFVGPEADYYYKQWKRLDGQTGQGKVFNWGALLCSVAWLPYRKMYTATVFYYAALIAAVSLTRVLYIDVLGNEEAPEGIVKCVVLILHLVCGGLANSWYLAHASRTIEETRAKGLDDEKHRSELARRGGTSGLIAVCAVVVFVAVLCMTNVTIERKRSAAKAAQMESMKSAPRR